MAAAPRQPETIGVATIEQSRRYVSEEVFTQLAHDKLSEPRGLNAQQLQAWTCTQCGATLPRKTDECDTVTCDCCATVYRLSHPKKRLGGIQISGTISVGGDIIGGDRIVFINSNAPTPEPPQPQTTDGDLSSAK